MLTRVRYKGANYVAKEVYANGFITLTGKRIHGEPFEVLGPQYCNICCLRHATLLRTQEDTLYRPKTEGHRTVITLTRFLCDSCNKLDRLPLKCKCGSPAVLSIGGKILHGGNEYWFRDQVCEACHESWNDRRDQFLRDSLYLVRPFTHPTDG